MESCKNEKSLDYKRYYCLWCVFISFIFFGRYIRGIFLISEIANINALGFFSCIYMGIQYIKTKGAIFSKSTFKFIILFIILNLLFFYSEIINGKELKSIGKCYIGLIIPLLIIQIKFQNFFVFKIFFERFLKVFNSVIYVLFICAIIDYFTKGALASVIFGIINNDTLLSISKTGRFVSILGHPLFNTELFIAFFGLNVIKQKYFTKEKNTRFIYIALLGVLFTASKTGVVLMIIAIIVLNVSKPSKMFPLLLLVLLFYYLGFFDLFLERLFSGSLTSNRAEKWIQIVADKDIILNWLNGHGNGSVFQLNNNYIHASAAFEYPLRLYAYEFGLLFTIIISTLLFIIPILKLLRNNQYILLILLLTLIIDVNTYNGIGLYHDYMYVYCTFLCIYLNISKFIDKGLLK